MNPERLFQHRLVNGDTICDPADSTALIDNASQALDNARAMAGGIYAMSAMIGGEFDEQDIRDLAGALIMQIRDIQALIVLWDEARH